MPTKSASSFAPFRFAFDAVMAYLLTSARTLLRGTLIGFPQPVVFQ
ncbi:hypothetical protein [Roseibium alexandrii]|nr:hypothetical protein [Roseibium alexandrii]